MEFGIAFMRVPDPQNIVPVGIQSGKVGLFEVVHECLLVGFGRLVCVCKGQNARGVLPLVVDRVDQINGALWISPKYFWRWIPFNPFSKYALSGFGVKFGYNGINAITDWPFSCTNTPSKKTNYHHQPHFSPACLGGRRKEFGQ